MTVDPLSPIAPARMHALLLPIGKIRRSRFLGFAQRLQAQNVVRLGDVSPDGRPSKNSFFPLAFPSGMIVYDLSIAVPPNSHLEVFHFEPFREPLAVIAIADGTEYDIKLSVSSNDEFFPQCDQLKDLVRELDDFRDQYPKSLLRKLLIFDHHDIKSLLFPSDGTIWIPSPESSRPTTIKTVMCDISSTLLWELGNFAESIKEWPAIKSPEDTFLQYGMPMASDPRQQKLQHRVTMPATLPSKPTDEQLNGESPTTFDEITKSITFSNQAAEAASRASVKEYSRERMSVQTVGTPVTERMKSRVKGRYHVFVGTLYLQAGRWPDALRELVEGAGIARSGSDYLWHAKALELILVSLIMLSWAGMDFQIPRICYPIPDKSTSKSSSHNTTSSGDFTSGQMNFEARDVSLKNLVQLIPDISNHILHLYTRAANITDESLPQVLFSEVVIRLTRLQTTLCLCDGFLDDDALKHIVTNKPLQPSHFPEHPQGAISLRKNDIAAFLLHALPSTDAIIPVTDSVSILVGIGSVLSRLGLERKNAFILKELLAVLVPGLIQARKVGAAEMGIHPATGLRALTNTSAFEMNALDTQTENMEDSIRSFLSLVGGIYGVADQEDNASISGSYDSVEKITARAFRDSYLKSFGDITLKVEILRACISFCEALPDFKGVVQFATDLLHTVKGTLMLAPDYYVAPDLTQEEQVRLLNLIRRSVGVAHAFGSESLEAEFWDDFLVRGVELANTTDDSELVCHSKTDFGIADHMFTNTTEKSPFIFNPFAKAKVIQTENLLIAGEPATFKITLQNPFEFDLEIESLHLEGEGVSFEGSAEKFLLAAMTLQDKYISGTAHSDGTLKISGCRIKVRYCRERRFPIFKKTWKPKYQPKMKQTGLAAKSAFSEHPMLWYSSTSGTVTPAHSKAVTGPETASFEIKVLRPQPAVVIVSTTLSQSAIMVLEGETQSFSLTLRNVSSCPVDFVFITFQDSISKQIREALAKDNITSDTYELELRLVTNRALSMKHQLSGEDSFIPPGHTKTFTIDVFGKAGLENAMVQIDYGFAGMSLSQMPERFYSRQLSLPLTITVNSAIELTRCDILPYSGDFAFTNVSNASKDNMNEDHGIATPASDFSRIFSRPDKSARCNSHCLLFLDFRNAWPNLISVSVGVRDHLSDPKQHTITDTLQAGHSARFVLPIPRIYIDDPHATIPSLNTGANKRQFVVSAHKLSYEAEAANREFFWFREELLKHLSCTWQEVSSPRKGIVDLRSIRLNQRILEPLRVQDVEISFFVEPLFENNTVRVLQKGHSKFIVPTDTFLRLIVTIKNNQAFFPLHPIVRLQPSLRNQPHTIALELSKRFAWTGMLQRTLPVVGPKQAAQVSLGVTALCRGEYEIGASIEEVQLLKPLEDPAGAADAMTEIDGIKDTFKEAAPRKRRHWDSRVSCVISAQ